MHMTLEADYAVRIVEFLAVNPGRADAKTISERTSVTRSYKGAKGGYELAKPPKEITLRSVIEAVEGPYMISRCQGDAYSCQRTSCRLHHIYGEVSQLVRNKLESYTFASICACEDTEADEKGEGKEAET